MKMLNLTILLIGCLSAILTNVCAFQEAFLTSAISDRRAIRSGGTGIVSLHESQLSDYQGDNTQTRRSFVDKLTLFPLVALPFLVEIPTKAQASGGATAGGAYLLSAKKRYYERVKTSVSGLLQAVDGLKEGDSKVAKEFFSSQDDGSWKDLTAAGYLLSNAFRRSSSTAPDSLPAVKKYKAFAKEVDNLQKVLKKKGAAAAFDEFATVEVALDEWLSEIDLPAAREL